MIAIMVVRAGFSNDQMIDATKRRLKLWNVSDQEIAEARKKAENHPINWSSGRLSTA